MIPAFGGLLPGSHPQTVCDKLNQILLIKQKFVVSAMIICLRQQTILYYVTPTCRKKLRTTQSL